MFKRWFVRLLLVVISVAVPVAALSLLPAWAGQAADTTVPRYGAPSYLNGSPVGGGAGYTGTVSASQADFVVSTPAALKSALASAASGQIVYVADGATITLSSDSQMYSTGAGVGFYVRPGVTLAGGRGNSGVTPGTIQVAGGFRSNGWCYLIQCGTGADVCGLNLYGNQDSTASGYTWTAIRCGVSTEVYNSEVHGFGYAGITALPDITGVWVHHNYIHHCRGIGHGYGVEVAAVSGVLSHDDDFHVASALVEGNIIDYTRHCIANQSGRGSYTFRYNYLGASAAYEAQCDVHGQNDDPGGSPDTMARAGGQYVYCAGQTVEIYNNTSACTNANEFVGARGFPYGSNTILVHHNWLRVTGDPCLIVQFMFRMPGWKYTAIDNRGSMSTGSGYGPFVQMRSYENHYGAAAPSSTSSPSYAPSTSQPQATTSGQPSAAPRAPTLLACAAGTVTRDNTPSLDWTDVTGDGSVRYRLQVDDQAGFSSPAVNRTVDGSSSTLPALPDEVYYWRVSAIDAAGNTSAWTGAWTFTIDTKAPPAPGLVSPRSGTVTADHTPFLDWSAVTDATSVHYQLYLDNNANFSSPVIMKTWITTSYYTLAFKESLAAGRYYWKVRAVDAAGIASAWTASRWFRVT